ncbi:hypothetical protein B0H14DRAFT_2658602 [Mycena olivaceomarginata]|nr:hypothetical protein B0H14DRAFT_2658602 [Mycena olivaceomarginata]
MPLDLIPPKKCHHAPQPAAESPTRPRPDLARSKHDKSSSKGAPKPAPKAPKAPKPKTASRRKHEHSVPPVELAAAVESEDEDDTEAQEDDEPDELGEEDKERGERAKSVPEDKEHDKSPSCGEKLAEQPSSQPVEEDRPGGPLPVPPLPPKKPVEGEKSPTPPPQMPVEEERATGLPDPPPVPPPRPKKPVKEGEESPAPPPKAPAEEPVPPPPPKKIAEEDGADDSDEDPLDLENGSDDDDVGAAEPERGKAAAIANTLQLRRKQRKDARSAVAKALEAWLADTAAKAAELSTAHGKPPGECLDMHQVKAIIKDEPADAWTEDELKALKADFIAFDEQRESGKRVTKRAAAQDVTFTCDKIFEEMQSLEQRTGQFVPEILKMPTTALPLTFQRWASLDKVVKPKGQNKRAQVAEMIRLGLNEMFGTTTVPVEYKNVREKIEAGMGVRFFGWVENMPWVATSNLGTGGADTINTMGDRLKVGTAGWCDIAEDEHHRLLQEFPGQENNYRMWKSKQDMVKAREAEEGG